MCCTRLAANAGPKKVAKNRHLRTIPQLCRAISSQLRHISTIGKNVLNSDISPTCPPQYGELRPTSGWDRFVSLGHPRYFQRISRLGSVILHGTLVVGVSQTAALNRGRHLHSAGHWPTFLVMSLTFCWERMSQVYVASPTNTSKVVRGLCYMNLANSCILISVIVTPVIGISKYVILC